MYRTKISVTYCSACQRSVMLECPVNSQQIGKINAVASDDTIDVKLLLNGILIGIFKVF